MKGARPLTRDEFDKMLKSFDGKYAERNRCLFLLGTSAMTRVSELAALNVGDVYQGGLVVSELVCGRRRGTHRTLRKQIVKGKKESRIAVLPPETVEAIRDFIAWKVSCWFDNHSESSEFTNDRSGLMVKPTKKLNRLSSRIFCLIIFSP